MATISQTNPQTFQTSAKPAMTLALVGVVVLFGIVGLWASFSTLSGAVLGAGRIVVSGQAKTVQHLDGGIVDSILVENAQRVEKGDVLIRFDKTLLSANLEITQNRLRQSLALQARLEAERDSLKAILWQDERFELVGGVPDAMKAGQESIFAARQRSLGGQKDQTAEKVTQLENQLEGVAALRAARQTQLKLVQEELAGLKTLIASGNTTTNRLMETQRTEAELQGQIAELGAQSAQIQSAIAEAKITLLQRENAFQEEVKTDLARVTSEINDLTQQFIATREQLARVEVIAPVSGLVHELAVFTEGGVVGPGAIMMKIIPVNEELDLEVKIDPQFVDQLYPGQEAVVRFTAFNQRTTPELFGTVTTIAPDVTVDQATGYSYYTVDVKVSPEELARLEGQTLIPGMPVEVHMTTDSRTPLSYLTKPLTDQIKRAWRE